MTRVRPTPLTWFLCGLIAVLVAYTWLAWGMDWRAPAGRLGPGFFPRVIGVVGIALCAVAAVRSLRPAEPGSTERRYPLMVAAAAAGLVTFLLLLIPLGALLASALFMFGLSWLMRRDHLVRNIAVSVLVPAALYVLFEMVLDAGLPEGLLIPMP
jgi:putative tricarboxylic transport membrane protein